MVGEIDWGTVGLDRADPAFKRAAEAYTLIAEKAGGYPGIGAELPEMLARHGLEQVQAEEFRTLERGGSTVATALSLTFERLRERCREVEVPEADTDRARALAEDPAVGVYGPSTWTAWGRRPALDPGQHTGH
ncbi:MAG TPA: hypothetical protein VI248_00345 [Kineosporiaceae bacterium]